MGVVHSASSLGATNTANTDICSFKGVPNLLQELVLPPPQRPLIVKLVVAQKKTTDYGEKYEVIPLDTGIIFDCEGYRVPTFMPVED